MAARTGAGEVAGPMIRFPSADGRTDVIVNPANVDYLWPTGAGLANDWTRIFFAGGNTVTVAMRMDDVVKALKGGA